MSRISFYCVDRKKNFSAYIPKYFYEIVLFDEPMYLVSVQIFREENDRRKYIVTLYTNKFFINLDRDIFIKNFDFNFTPESIKVVNDNTVMMNLHSVKFIKGTLRLKRQDDKINTILHYSSNIDNEHTYMNTFENNNISTWDDYNCSKMLTECESNHNQEKKRFNNGDCNDCDRKLIEKEKEYNSSLIVCEENRTSCCNGERTCNNEKSELYQLNEQKDQEIQKFKNLQSTQNTLVIIGLLIITVLLGFGIYLYFKKQ